MLTILQFDAAEHGGARTHCSPPAACRCSPTCASGGLARSRGAGHRVRRRRPALPLQRRPTRRARALLPVPVVGHRSAGPLHGRLPRAAADLGTARPARDTHARGRSLREPAAAVAPPGALVCGWQLHRPRRAAAVERAPRENDRLEQLFGKPEPVDEVFGRSTPSARCSGCGAACSGPRAGLPTPPRSTCASRLRPRLAHLLRRARGRSPVLGPLPTRSRRSRRHQRRGAGTHARRRLRRRRPRARAHPHRAPRRGPT